MLSQQNIDKLAQVKNSLAEDAEHNVDNTTEGQEHNGNSRKRQRRTNFLTAVINTEDSEVVRFRFTDDNVRPMIEDVDHLYHAMNTAIREELKDGSFQVRYGSQVRDQNFPFLFSNAHRFTLLDPLAIVHNPISTLLNRGYLTLRVYASEPYHRKPPALVHQTRLSERAAYASKNTVASAEESEMNGNSILQPTRDES
jgi:hypothetical protein